MTPQASRAPAFPVVHEVFPCVPISEESPLPKSSSSSCTTTARPTMELGPERGICTSSISHSHASAVARMFPRSPAWRSSSVGDPCFLPFGLKCGPVLMHPLVVSPNSWMWNPCFPAARPVKDATTLVGPSPDCVNVTVPATPALPVKTQMAFLSSATTTTEARPALARVTARGLRDALCIGRRTGRKEILSTWVFREGEGDREWDPPGPEKRGSDAGDRQWGKASPMGLFRPHRFRLGDVPTVRALGGAHVLDGAGDVHAGDGGHFVSWTGEWKRAR